MINYEKLNALSENNNSYELTRLISSIYFLSELSNLHKNNFNNLLNKAIDKIAFALSSNKKITMDFVSEIENDLGSLTPFAKAFTVYLVAHAHIDMNWMWRYDETVSVTLSTFRTVLDLMNEYPNFTFSQSQASVYEIVEKYDKSMLLEIKRRVKEGRWEISASTWVETDKNMPSGESLVRQILYTKEYLSSLFEIDKNKLNLDFEPDTFGHNASTPKILASSGVKYYYHCRGYDKENIFNWQANDGSFVLTYREPIWYNADISYDDFYYLPGFADKNNINVFLKVYGIGNHGGGPTRRDINRILDMQTWPLLPKIEFGTYAKYFRYLESIKSQFPNVKGELNSFATGCYTTQTRIKKFNKICEVQLYEAELTGAICHQLGLYSYPNNLFADAWKKVLFNQFHDILPGSGTIDTREFAMGQYQQALAVSSSQKNIALSAIANQIDASSLLANYNGDKNSTSEGAGVGYNHSEMNFLSAERNNGTTRIYTLFNYTNISRQEPVMVTVWDYPKDISNILITDENKNVLEYQVIDHNPLIYWSHSYTRIYVYIEIPAFGYKTIKIEYKNNRPKPYDFPNWPRLDQIENYILENDFIKVRFDSMSGSIVYLYDKKRNKTILDHSSGYFRLIHEDTTKEMTAWIIGRYKSVENINKNLKIENKQYTIGNLISTFSYEISFRNSKLWVEISLKKGERKLDYQCKCDFREIGTPQQITPQLSFYLPLNHNFTDYIADIPFGIISRKQKNLDMPANNYVFIPDLGIMLMSNSKYGFRVFDNAISLTLIRNSYEPDPLPDFGVSTFDFSIAIPENGSPSSLTALNFIYKHNITSLSASGKKGKLPLTSSFLEITEKNIIISAVKKGENNGIVIRFYEIDGKDTEFLIKTIFNFSDGYYLDSNENILTKLDFKNGIPYVIIRKNSICTVLLM